jgi:hypothetical protein
MLRSEPLLEVEVLLDVPLIRPKHVLWHAHVLGVIQPQGRDGGLLVPDPAQGGQRFNKSGKTGSQGRSI